jgi:ubiquinone/menaquinone biosynthesis C-methylase UbiE
LQAHFHSHDDAYLSEMEATDKSGPGTLELAPTMHIPEHASHQIHIQPGGYVGDPFAGHMYHYATNSFWAAVRGPNDQDEIHRTTVNNLPVPKDRKVRRILDYGCGIGQFAVALKERFPDAEVWGLDIGGPMVRYSHMRASKLNVDVNFVQRLAEDNGFADGYFDIVTSYIAHHEMPSDVSRQVIAEAQRVTRPGGVYYPVDFITGGSKMIPRSLFGRWWDHRWNNERWSLEYHAMDFNAEIQARGFDQVKNVKPVIRGFGNRYFIRT